MTVYWLGRIAKKIIDDKRWLLVKVSLKAKHLDWFELTPQKQPLMKILDNSNHAYAWEVIQTLPNLKNILMSKWQLIQNQPLLREIFKEPPIISYKSGKSLKDKLVQSKLSRLRIHICAQQELGRPVTIF